MVKLNESMNDCIIRMFGEVTPETCRCMLRLLCAEADMESDSHDVLEFEEVLQIMKSLNDNK
jgi:hypothetical protein